jgi:hypothetical protein
MVSVLEQDRERYELYAVLDTKICLEFYAKFFHTYYYTITEKLVAQIPLTVSGASELFFLA